MVGIKFSYIYSKFMEYANGRFVNRPCDWICRGWVSRSVVCIIRRQQATALQLPYAVIQRDSGRFVNRPYNILGTQKADNFRYPLIFTTMPIVSVYFA